MFLLITPVSPADLDFGDDRSPILDLRLIGFLDCQIRGVHWQGRLLMMITQFDRVTPLAPGAGLAEIPAPLIEIQMRLFVPGESLGHSLDLFPFPLIESEAPALNCSHLESLPSLSSLYFAPLAGRRVGRKMLSGLRSSPSLNHP